MFQSTDLKDKLEQSHTIENEQKIWIEWNLNQSYNISKVGNYRYRPGKSDPVYGLINSIYDSSDVGNYYTGATDSDTIINAGFNDDKTPTTFTTPKQKIKLIYSLEDCFKQNRPRSGINKLLYLGISGATYGTGQYIDSLTSGKNGIVNYARRPRYYMSSRYDDFKYWTSYRTEVTNNVTNEFGISINQSTGTISPSYYIYDAAPFVVYNDPIPANRVTIKMQTNVGEVDTGPYRIGNNPNVADPLYGLSNRTVPRIWRIQGLDKDNKWVELISFSESQTRSDGSPIIASDGQVEIEYGLNIPDLFKDTFTFAGEISSISLRPDLAPYGYAYLYKTSDTDKGILYISDGTTNWRPYDPEYSWSLSNTDITKNTKVVKKFTNPDYYLSSSTKVFREFEFLYGLRVVVDTMNKANCTFDLIELSPRLVGNITEKVQSFSITKTLSDLGTYSLPTGALLASTGNISLFDDDLSFNENNTFDMNSAIGSIISQYSNSRIKFLFYDVVKNINGYDYYIPIKTMYSEKIPQVSDGSASLSMELRDLFFLLESKKSPEILLPNASLSYAITVLLDSIGFSNYVFKRTVEDEELIIPFFFVGPGQNIAETLQQLAISSQSAIFFDEYNNLVIMSKNYLLPSATARSTDMTLYGQETIVDGNTLLPNIVNVASQEKKTFNGGEINYTTRYIQKSIGSIAQAPYTAEYQTYIYKPVLLWEVAGQEMARTINEGAQQSSGYSLAAMPLKTTIPAVVPTYSSGSIHNNIIDFGENIYWLGNYAGYFYANGEIIKYDAVEYSVAGVGNVWIENNQQYQDYFSKLVFNGKMYPTGNVRIYSNVQQNIVQEHGRGQFGTPIVEHKSGINSSTWVNDSNVRGSIQNARDYLFNTNINLSYSNDTGIEEAGAKRVLGTNNTYVARSYAIQSTRNSVIKNFMANTNLTENTVNHYSSALSGSVQTSALVFNGPVVPSEINAADFVTYVYQPLEKPYKHFGTRMRIIGKIESGTNVDQTPVGAFDIYSPSGVISTNPEQQVSLKGGSGGISFGLNKDTNIGYYFEIAALSQTSISSYKDNSNASSYTIKKDPVTQATSDSVLVTLSTQHDFEVGNNIIVSGLVDDNLNTNSNTPLNGQFTVTEISSDRKQFKYKIPAPKTTSQTIVKATHDDKQTIYTTLLSSFSAGQKITVTGLTSTYNGSFVIDTVSTVPDQKNINAVSANGSYITYTTSVNHGFLPGQQVNVSGLTATVDPGENMDAYNWELAFIYDTPTLNTFRIASNLNPLEIPINNQNGIVIAKSYNIIVKNVPSDISPAADSSGTITYVPLTTTASTGGTVTKVLDSNTLISDVFFYKIVSGSNTADVIKKQKTSGTVTLTTLRSHSFLVGESVVIAIGDANFDGTYQITAVQDKTISYAKTGTDVSLTNLSTVGLITGVDKLAIPVVLWRGFSEILVDDGKFTSQARLTTTESTTVYDLSVEYIDIGTTRTFYLYLNDKQIAVVNDDSPLPFYNNLALFVRGNSRVMFENVYALSDNFADNTARSLQLPVSKIFNDDDITEKNALQKYAISGIVQNTYLSGISSQGQPVYDLYYEEFGTIMREAAYFNIKYDRAFPALYAQLAKTINRAKGYTISGFYAGSYGAEFLIFNAIDKNLNLDDTTGNYLRILGISFTQNTTHSLKVDDFFKKNSNFVDSLYSGSNDSENYQALYTDILNSRNKYGRNDFSIDAQYVQTTAAAESMMDWTIKKVLYPRKSVGVATFATPHVQLGDIVQIVHKDPNGVPYVANESTRFVVYNIEYQKGGGSTSTTIHLAEV